MGASENNPIMHDCPMNDESLQSKFSKNFSIWYFFDKSGHKISKCQTIFWQNIHSQVKSRKLLIRSIWKIFMNSHASFLHESIVKSK